MADKSNPDDLQRRHAGRQVFRRCIQKGETQAGQNDETDPGKGRHGCRGAAFGAFLTVMHHRRLAFSW
ncbi:hypothetical protein QW131_20690 [Roseibium salinum]|nr:hypothetical protein [Roseibium salinum]